VTVRGNSQEPSLAGASWVADLKRGLGGAGWGHEDRSHGLVFTGGILGTLSRTIWRSKRKKKRKKGFVKSLKVQKVRVAHLIANLERGAKGNRALGGNASSVVEKAKDKGGGVPERRRLRTESAGLDEGNAERRGTQIQEVAPHEKKK